MDSDKNDTLEQDKQGMVNTVDEDNISQLMDEGERMFFTGDFQGLNKAENEDDALSQLSVDDMRRDQILEGLKHVAGEPNPELMKPYRMPVDHMLQMNLNSDNESLKDISSDESNQEEGDSKEDNFEEEEKMN